jgi:hypothetical protein
MNKAFLILFVLGLSLFKLVFADTITSSSNTGKQKAEYNTVTSHQQGAPAKVVKPTQNVNPIVVVPLAPGAPQPAAPARK